MDFYYQDVTTLYELFRKAEKISSMLNIFLIKQITSFIIIFISFKDDNPYLGWKPSPNEPYKWLKYSEVNEAVEKVGSAFLEFGLEPRKESFVGIYAKNRVEVNFYFNKLIIVNFIKHNF